VRKLRPRLRALSEAEAYHRCHGERNTEVRIVHLEPRRPRYPPRVSGEDLRTAFERRLDQREEAGGQPFYRAVQPPSTGSTTPVTKREASPARKTAAAATSSGLPGSPVSG
jgi:hypothetical protein